MFFGDKKKVGIESSITCSYENESLLAMGFFLIHVSGVEYGNRALDATLLSNSFNSVKERLKKKGAHDAMNFATSASDLIAMSTMQAIYWEDSEERRYFGMPADEYTDILYRNDLIWAPDGDAAFDDGSHVIQFDLKDRVRVIAFKSTEVSKVESLTDITMPSDEFYQVLSRWVSAFEEEWRRSPKSTSSTSH